MGYTCIPMMPLNPNPPIMPPILSMAGNNSHLRRQVWECLKVDDATRLLGVLENESKARGMSLVDFVDSSVSWMWKNDGDEREDKSKGLIVVMATNDAGIPDHGCIRCLECVLSKIPPGEITRYQIRRAYHGAVYRGRDGAAKALEKHFEYWVTSES